MYFININSESIIIININEFEFEKRKQLTGHLEKYELFLSKQIHDINQNVSPTLSIAEPLWWFDIKYVQRERKRSTRDEYHY